jgi:two-component system sensor histidine kinase PilS (NtrC family)
MENSPPSGPYTDRRRKPQTWRALRLFFFYRLVLVSALSAAYFSGLGPSYLGSSSAHLFEATIVVYLGLVVSSSLFQFWRSPPADQQVQSALFIDIIAITLLMHASGGITSGLGLLIAVSIANGSLLLGGRLALLFAALASLAILTEQLYAQLKGLFPVTAYTQAGMLGITFFAIALLAHVLSRRVQETERLARQRGLDLANLAQLNEYIIRNMNTGVLVVDRDSSIRLMNETAHLLTGLPKTGAGTPLSAVLPELSLLLDSWRRDPQTPPPAFQPQPGARELKPELTPLGADAGTLIILEDSARVAAQAQQMKLAALGRLTASIAHEIRNPLGAISHAGQLLAESPELNRGDRRLTEIIKDNSIRVNDVIETVLQLSRRDRAQPEYLRLSSWTGHFVDDFCRSRSVDPEVFQVHIEPADFLVQADPRQLQQILGNLCDNALKYAAGADRSPQIRIEGGLELEGRYPLLDVIDNGPGIPSENTNQIFEPFFTTGAKGTGLGLYIVKELCANNNIEIEYIAPPGVGSCFRLGFRSWKNDEKQN